ncbi:MAG: hypothetical protein ACK56I_02020, partial [bacterium]
IQQHKMATPFLCCENPFIAMYEIARTKIKTQKMSGGASHRHSSFGFNFLSKTYIAIPNHLGRATDNIY